MKIEQRQKNTDINIAKGRKETRDNDKEDSKRWNRKQEIKIKKIVKGGRENRGKRDRDINENEKAKRKKKQKIEEREIQI